MVKWSIPCDVWLSKSSTPDNPSPRMAFAAGWNAATASATPHNKPSAPCARTDCQYYPGDYECNPCVHNHPWLLDHYTRRTVG